MRMMILAATVATVALVTTAHAQADYPTTNPVEKNLIMNGKTYDSMHSSLESQGGVGQYGTYLYLPANAKASGGFSGNGSETLDKTYRVNRFGTDAPGQGHGSYTTVSLGGMNAYGFNGMGRTGGSMAR